MKLPTENGLIGDILTLFRINTYTSTDSDKQTLIKTHKQSQRKRYNSDVYQP